MKSYIKYGALALVLVVVSVLIFQTCRRKAPPATVKDYSDVELTYYKVFDDSDVINGMMSDFIADHPGITINYRQFSDFDEYTRTVLNEIADGEGPDIFSMQNTWFTSNKKKITPMPSDLGTKEDFAKLFVNIAYRDLVLPDENGREQIYGLPMTVDTLALYYNKDHFEDRIPSRGRPAKTWEGIKEDVALLNKEDTSFDRFEVSGIAMGRADNITRAIDVLYLMFLQFGVEMYNDNVSEAIFAGKQSTAVSYPGAQALELYVGFADPAQKHFSWNEFVVDDDLPGKEIEAFAEGKVSMILGYSFTYDYILDYINFSDAAGRNTIDKDAIRVAEVPQLIDPEVSTEKRVTYGSYFAETVSRTTEHPEIAWELLLHMTTRDNLEYYFDKTHKPTSRRDMIEEQRKHPIYGVFASQIGYAESFPVIDYNSYKEIFSETINQANLNGAIQGDFVKAQNRVNELLDPAGYLVPINNDEEDEE